MFVCRLLTVAVECSEHAIDGAASGPREGIIGERVGGREAVELAHEQAASVRMVNPRPLVGSARGILDQLHGIIERTHGEAERVHLVGSGFAFVAELACAPTSELLAGNLVVAQVARVDVRSVERVH